MRGAARWVVPLTLALSHIVAQPRAFAQDSAPTSCKDLDAAVAHFKRGNQLYEEKNLAQALVAFRDSRALCPSENNTLNIALLLKELDRPLEALDMLDQLKRDYPILLPENAETVKSLRDALEPRVGTVIFDGDYPGARIQVDGKDVGTMPQSRPLKLPVGMHKARVELDGHQPLETTFMVMPRGNIQVAVVLAAAPTVKKEPPKESALDSMNLGISFALTPDLGGKVSDCDECSAPPGVGSFLVGGYRHRLTESVRFGFKAGHLFLWQARSQVGSTTVIDETTHYADVDDGLFLNGFFAGPEISISFDLGGGYADIGLALGPIVGPLVNARTAENGRTSIDGVTVIDFVPPTMTETSGFGGLFLFVQGSWRTGWSLAPGWPLHVTLGVLGFAPVNVPEFEASFTANLRDSDVEGQAVFQERLIGSWVFVFTPGLTVYHDL